MPFFRTSKKDTNTQDVDLSFTAYYIKNGQVQPLKTQLRQLTYYYNKNNFNSSVTFGDGIGYLDNFFSTFNKYNQPVILPNSLISLASMFNGCHLFNQPVVIPHGVENCYYMFNGCLNFNSMVTIPNTVINCRFMFENCRNFNQPVTIPHSVVDCSYMFSFCYNLNSPIIIENGVVSCVQMFPVSGIYNLPVVIPRSVENARYMLRCPRISEVYINGNPDIFHMLALNNNLRVNVYCGNEITQDRLSNIFNGKTNISLTPMDNGYYNPTYNLYVYTNYIGT